MDIMNNKIDKVFGPLASEIALFTCVILIPFYIWVFHIKRFLHFDNIVDILFGVIWVFLIFLGLFIGFTTTCTQIDFTQKRVKFYTKLFGIIPAEEKWIYVTPDMKLRLKKKRKRVFYNRSQHLYGRHGSYRIVEPPDWRIILYDKANMEIAHIKKFKNAKNAEAELKKMSDLLDLRII
jgi:hypothetical protein